MLTEPAATTTPKPPAPAFPSPDIPSEHDPLRSMAIEQLERVRSFKLHLTAYVAGIIALTGVWVLTQYNDADGWPDRLSNDGNVGSWDPWIIYVALIWGLVVFIQGVKTYFRRPPSEAEIAREVERLKRSV